MRLMLTAALLGALTSSSANASDLQLIPGRFFQEKGYSDQVFTLKNNTARRLDQVIAECGIFQDDELIEVSGLSFTDVPPHGEAYDHVNSLRPGVTSIKCRLKNLR